MVEFSRETHHLSASQAMGFATAQPIELIYFAGLLAIVMPWLQ
jgi:hypothetical protein